jgi:hypothetical protein
MVVRIKGESGTGERSYDKRKGDELIHREYLSGEGNICSDWQIAHDERNQFLNFPCFRGTQRAEKGSWRTNFVRRRSGVEILAIILDAIGWVVPLPFMHPRSREIPVAVTESNGITERCRTSRASFFAIFALASKREWERS